MELRIAEIFRSTQGEGRNAGRSAIFVRLSGCNIKCPFCDTDHFRYKVMTENEIAAEVMKEIWPANVNLVIFTGGEPSLQLDGMRSVIYELKAQGYEGEIAVESNGTCDPLEFRKIGVDFVTISPKNLWVSNPITTAKMSTWINANEIKCLYDTTMDRTTLHNFLKQVADSNPRSYLYLQPITSYDPDITHKNTQATLGYINCLDARWCISMQLQNIWKVR